MNLIKIIRKKILSMLNNENKERIGKVKSIKLPFIPKSGLKHSRKKKVVMKQQKVVNKNVEIKTKPLVVNLDSWYRHAFISHSSMGQGVSRSGISMHNADMLEHNLEQAISKTINPIEKKESKRVTINGYNSKEFKISFPIIYDYRKHIYIMYSPTGNCQLVSIRQVYTLTEAKEEDLDEIFKKLKERSKKQMLIDIHVDYDEKLKPILDKYLDMVVRTPYDNSTGSKMVLYIYKWKEIELKEFKPLDDLPF